MAVVDACSATTERICVVEIVGSDSDSGSIVIIEAEGERPWWRI